LLIDDDPEVRDGVVAALLKREWEPLVATNVQEAIETVDSEGPPDAIVTDLRLGPRECGLDAITAIHKMTGRTIASVIITGDASHHRLPEAMESPWPILVKPFSTDELYSAITEMVLKERASAYQESVDTV
jgi:DNA-binding NtrC family response regulator